MRKWLAVDVDGVVVDTHSLYSQAKLLLDDPLDFWRSETLYDELEPMQGAVDKLTQLNQYWDIVFVSRLKGNHHKSKVSFCKKWFPFMKGFVGTHEKYLLQESYVCLIDDLADNLVNLESNKGYLFTDWESFDVKEFCKEHLK